MAWAELKPVQSAPGLATSQRPGSLWDLTGATICAAVSVFYIFKLQCKHLNLTLTSWYILYTLWLFNIAMENGPFIDGLPIKNGDFPWLC